MSQSASGLVAGRLVFSKRKTGQQARFQRSNIDLNSFSQQRNRDVYKDAVAEWNLLSAAEKNIWKIQAAKLPLTGFNLFVKIYYMNTVRKVATLKNIDGKTTFDYTFYIPPAGTSFIPTGFVVRCVAISGYVEPGNFFVRGFTSSENIMFTISDYITTVGKVHLVPNAGETINACQKITPENYAIMRVGTPVTADVFLLDVDLLGYLIED